MGINTWCFNGSWWRHCKALSYGWLWYNRFHFDRGDAKKEAEKTINEVNDLNGGRSVYINTNAASAEAIEKYLPK